MDSCSLAFNSHVVTLGTCMPWAAGLDISNATADMNMNKDKAQNMVNTFCTSACVTGISNLRKDVIAACSTDKEAYKNAITIHESQQASCIKDGDEWCQVKMVTLTGNGKGEVTDWKAFCGPCLEKQAKVFTDPTVSISKLPVNSSSNETLSGKYKNYVDKCASMGYSNLSENRVTNNSSASSNNQSSSSTLTKTLRYNTLLGFVMILMCTLILH